MNNMKWKKWISTDLSMIMAVSAFALTAPRVRGAEEKPTEPGLWITEIYQNDVKREDLFANSSDHMEFVEVINTSDRSVETQTYHTIPPPVVLPPEVWRSVSGFPILAAICWCMRPKSPPRRVWCMQASSMASARFPHRRT